MPTDPNIEIPELMGLLTQCSDYTPQQQRRIQEFLEAGRAQEEALRERLAQNTPTYTLVPITRRRDANGWFVMPGGVGLSPFTDVVQWCVVPTPGHSRIGHVEQDKNGKWFGMHYEETKREPTRDTQENAVIDVFTQYLLRGGRAHWVEETSA